jgi:hypothetical protein
MYPQIAHVGRVTVKAEATNCLLLLTSQNGKVCYPRCRISLETSRGGAMKWEYKMVRIQMSGKPEKAVDELNVLGSEGWEAVSAWVDSISTHVLLKRGRKE